ncbi:hypothetical protein ACQ4PT_020400 [Festuca glaucescens]
MDQAEVVRRSVAKISFNWRNNHSLNKKTVGSLIHMVIPGVIISKKDGECLMVANPCFFQPKHRLTFQVNLPEPDGKYGQNIKVDSHKKIVHEEFCGFVVKANDYVQPVIFELSPMEQRNIVFAFSFPREVATSVSYSAGHIVESSQSNQVGIFFHDCALHEYGFLGSPIFNEKGYAVGICFATQSRIHAWTPRFLKAQFDITFLNEWSSRVTYLSDNPNQQGAPPPASSSSGMDMELGVVPQHVAGSSRTVVPGSSVPSCSAPHRVPAFPSGVVTLAYKSDLTSETQYFPGIIITCEPGEGKAHTTFVFSSHKAYFNEVYVYFGPNRKVEGKVCASDHGFMIVIIVDDEYHEPLAWNNSVLASYDLVRTISIMSGTKLNAEATAPLQTLIGYLGSLWWPNNNSELQCRYNKFMHNIR